MTGRVVDADTKEPLEGVVVVVRWEVYGGGFHPSVVGSLNTAETVTDSSGSYAFPAWGPLTTEKGVLQASTPELIFVREGYTPLFLRNEHLAPYERRPTPEQSRWNGKTIELRRFTDTRKKYDVQVGLVTLHSWEPCEWIKAPRLTAELVNHGRACKREGIRCYGSPSLGFLAAGDGGQMCGDPREILADYLHE